MRTRGMASVGGLALLLAATAARADGVIFGDERAMPPITVPAGGMPLRDALAAVGKAVPDFHYVVTRSPGTPDDVPVLPPMQMQGLTIGQFLGFVNLSTMVTNGLTINAIEGTGGKPPLYVIDIKRPAEVAAPPRSAFPPTTVHVSSLAELVEPRAAVKTDGGDHVREATDDVLSAVQATLDAAAISGPPATLRVHQPTLTLITRGSDEQLQLIEQTLAALRPTQDGMQLAMKSAIEWQSRLSEQNDDLRRRLAAALGRTAPTTRPKG